MMSTGSVAGRPSLRPVALPTEHGGWSFVLEPIVLGLWIAPSLAGAALGAAALLGFLLRHPLKLALKDRQRGRRYPRTRLAEQVAGVYAGLGLAALLLAFALTDHAFWPPLAVAIPLAIIQISYDLRNLSREVTPEVFGAVALGSIAAAITMADGWGADRALAVWLILFARIVASILYVRARLRLERGQKPSLIPPHLAHGLGLLVVFELASGDYAPWLAVAAMSLLLARDLHGLSRFRRPAPRAQIIGIQEVIFGVITVILTALGYRLGW